LSEGLAAFSRAGSGRGWARRRRFAPEGPVVVADDDVSGPDDVPKPGVVLAVIEPNAAKRDADADRAAIAVR
jgi:hypothetical protein